MTALNENPNKAHHLITILTLTIHGMILNYLLKGICIFLLLAYGQQGQLSAL